MDTTEIWLNVRGRVPAGISGRLIYTCGRRNKRHSTFGRWHDSPADHVVIDVEPGASRLRARILSPRPEELALDRPDGRYGAQPNHAVNIAGRRAWSTNLHFGAPLAFDIETGDCSGVLEVLPVGPDAPQVTTAAHFAFTPDRRFAYFPQGLLADDEASGAVRTLGLKMVRMDTATMACRTWDLTPPTDDTDPIGHNFHSAFYYTRQGRPFVGLLKTGARFNAIRPHAGAEDHEVRAMPGSAVWVVPIDETTSSLQAESVPAFRDPTMRALSHLKVDTSSGDGYVLYCNYKQADVGQETHGPNIYGEPASAVWEHYAGMTVEPFGVGKVVRFDATGDVPCKTELVRPYDHGRIADGHTWLPINLSLGSDGRRVFASFAGFRPRLLSQHIVAAYPDLAISARDAGYAPPLLMRLDARTLQPDYSTPHALSYAEPIAFTLLPAAGRDDYVCTVSSELGLRIYDADDLSAVICEATAHQLGTWGDTHFRTDPAHVEFIAA